MSGAPNDDGASTSKRQLVSKDGAQDEMNPDPGGSSSIPFDEMAAWLRYPMEDSFEKHYCSDLFGHWPPLGTHIFKDTVFADNVQTGFVPSNLEQEGSVEALGNTSFWGSVANAGAVGGGNGGTSSLVRSNSADAALALGADRAAGLIDPAGFEAFSKVRTSMQPCIPKVGSPSFSFPKSAESFPALSSCPSSSFAEKASPTSMVTPAMVSRMLPPKTRSQGSYASKLPVQPTSRGFRNFANFSWPSAVLKADLAGAGLGTGGRKQCSTGLAAVGSSSAGFSLAESSTTIMDNKFDARINSSMAQSSGFSLPNDKATMIPVKRERDESSTRSSGVDVSFTVTHLDTSRKSSSAGSARLEPEKKTDAHEFVEIAMTSNSGDSQTSADRSMKEPASSGKRKLEDFECQSEDAEEESAETKHMQVRGTSKRSRAAEIHNLSEQRRRNRINEKMRVLRELIPNSNKTDKASMLDEAIEYLKTLQLQLQMMSMRTGASLSPMVMPAGTPQMQMPQMASMHPMGMAMTVGFPGMGTRMDLGTSMGMIDLSRTVLSMPSQILPSCPPVDSSTVTAGSSESCIQASSMMEYPPIHFSDQMFAPVQSLQPVNMDMYNAYLQQQQQQQEQQQSQHSSDSIGNLKAGSPQ